MSRAGNLRQALTQDNIAGGAEELPRQVIKSAGRALQILELFDVLQRRACVTEISSLLGYPQSSTTMLLRSLVAMGYLNFHIGSRTYVTSSRVTLLGKWAASNMVGDGSITRLMRRVNERTGQAVVLATRSGQAARLIHVVQAMAPAGVFVVQGSARPLVRSGTGFALLSRMPDAEIRRLVMRANSEGGVNGVMVDFKDLLEQIQATRERGYALTIGMVNEGTGMLAVPLPAWLAEEMDQTAAIGICTLRSILLERADEFVSILRDEFALTASSPTVPLYA